MTTIETDRLTISNFGPDAWQELQELAIQYRASESTEYEDPWPTSTEKVKGMAEWFAGGDEFPAVCLKATDKLIGMIAIERREDRDEREHNPGYVFRTDQHGHGYATEGCRAAMDYVFGQWAADGIRTSTHPENQPSVRLLKRLDLRGSDRGEYIISRGE